MYIYIYMYICKQHAYTICDVSSCEFAASSEPVSPRRPAPRAPQWPPYIGRCGLAGFWRHQALQKGPAPRAPQWPPYIGRCGLAGFGRHQALQKGDSCLGSLQKLSRFGSWFCPGPEARHFYRLPSRLASHRLLRRRS